RRTSRAGPAPRRVGRRQARARRKGPGIVHDARHTFRGPILVGNTVREVVVLTPNQVPWRRRFDELYCTGENLSAEPVTAPAQDAVSSGTRGLPYHPKASLPEPPRLAHYQYDCSRPDGLVADSRHT